MDIREIQRLHEQFAHAPLTIEAPIGIQHSASRMLPAPVYAAAGSLRWGIYSKNALLIGGVVAGILVAGALGMSIGNSQHRRAADADVPGDVAPAATHVMQSPDRAQPPIPVQPIISPAAMPPAASTPGTEMAQPADLSPTPAPLHPTAQSPMPVAPAPRSRPSDAPASNLSGGMRKAEPAPVQTKPAPSAPRAQHGNAATDIKLF